MDGMGIPTRRTTGMVIKRNHSTDSYIQTKKKNKLYTMAKTRLGELQTKLERMQKEVREWKTREMQSWIGKWGRSVRIKHLEREIDKTYDLISEELSRKRG